MGHIVYHSCCQSLKTQRRPKSSISNISCLYGSFILNEHDEPPQKYKLDWRVYSSVCGQRNDSSQANEGYAESQNQPLLGTTIANMVQNDLRKMRVDRYIYMYTYHVICIIYIYTQSLIHMFSCIETIKKRLKPSPSSVY